MIAYQIRGIKGFLKIILIEEVMPANGMILAFVAILQKYIILMALIIASF